MRKLPKFDSEAELCASFIAWTKRHGWTAYAETAGWDIVLAKPTGVQIGIQAKLRFNVKVIAQTIHDLRYHGGNGAGPDYRAILVGASCDGATTICQQLGIALFYPAYVYQIADGPEFSGDDEIVDKRHARFQRWDCAWFDWNPSKRIALPDYIPDVIAGASGPVQLTPWKVGALRLIATLEIRGHLTRADFKEHNVNPSRWTTHHSTESAWLLQGKERGQWVRGPALDIEQQHPTVYPQIRAEIAAKLEKQAAVA